MYTLSRRDHYNQAIRRALCGATCLSYGREEGFQAFLYPPFTSDSSRAHFRVLALKTRAGERAIKRGVITCDIYIILSLKIRVTSQWPVLGFSVSIGLFNPLVTYPSIAINSNHI